jgi:hypothetical protein
MLGNSNSSTYLGIPEACYGKWTKQAEDWYREIDVAAGGVNKDNMKEPDEVDIPHGEL